MSLHLSNCWKSHATSHILSFKFQMVSFQFLAELTLVDMETYLKYLPSITAAASLCLARFSLGLEPWVSYTNQECGNSKIFT